VTSIQLKTLRRRFTSGLGVSLAYTFAKSIDNQSVDPVGATSGGAITNTTSRAPVDIRDFRIAQPHDGAVPVILGDLLDGQLQVLVAGDDDFAFFGFFGFGGHAIFLGGVESGDATHAFGAMRACFAKKGVQKHIYS